MMPFEATVYLAAMKDRMRPSSDPFSVVWMSTLSDDIVSLLHNAMYFGFDDKEKESEFNEDITKTILMIKSYEMGTPGEMEFSETQFGRWYDNLRVSLVLEEMSRNGLLTRDDRSIFDGDKTWTKTPDFDERAAEFMVKIESEDDSSVNIQESGDVQ